MLVDRGSLLRKVSDRQLTSENINFNSISNMIYGISSMIYGIGASIDISVRSVLRESRPGFPARGHDSEFKHCPQSGADASMISGAVTVLSFYR